MTGKHAQMRQLPPEPGDYGYEQPIGRLPGSETPPHAVLDGLTPVDSENWSEQKVRHILQTFAYGILTPGQSRYSCPSDFSSDMSASILWGSTLGTAQGGSQTTIILQPGSTQGISDVLGKEVLLVSGTGIGSASQVIGLANNSGTITVGQAVCHVMCAPLVFT